MTGSPPGDFPADVLAALLAQAPADFDLCDEDHLAQVKTMAETLAGRADVASLHRLEHALLAETEPVPMMVHLAVKIARSRAIVQALPPVHVSVMFAVYKEHQRILPRSQHPHGEDFLARKLDQLRWLCEGSNVTWDLTVIDDGCPEGSGRIAEAVLAAQGETGRARVLFLADAIEQELPTTRGLRTTDDSRKGGSIEYGMWHAVEQPRRSHVVLFTDADLSTHLGQVGLLLEGIVTGGADAAIGTRRAATSVAIKKGTRNVRGKLFIYLWKRLLPQLHQVVDTQCGFKAFSAEVVRAVIEDVAEKGFAFDIELLVRVALRRPDAIAVVPIAWIDSEAASTTTDIQPYRSMLHSVVHTYRACVPSSPGADAFAAFIEALDDDRWGRLQGRVPAAIADREPAEFGSFDGVGIAELEAAAGEG